MIRTPEELRDFCKLPEVPPVSQTTKTTLLPLHDAPPELNPRVFQISDVNFAQLVELQKRMDGEMICLWFCEERRYAWLPRAPKAQDSEAAQ